MSWDRELDIQFIDLLRKYGLNMKYISWEMKIEVKKLRSRYLILKNYARNLYKWFDWLLWKSLSLDINTKILFKHIKINFTSLPDNFISLLKQKDKGNPVYRTVFQKLRASLWQLLGIPLPSYFVFFNSHHHFLPLYLRLYVIAYALFSAMSLRVSIMQVLIINHPKYHTRTTSNCNLIHRLDSNRDTT